MGEHGFGGIVEVTGLNRVYGRRSGRRLSPRREALLREALPVVQIPEAAEGTLSPAGLFGVSVSEVWCEVGFGGGEHLLGLARARPDIGLLGVDPFLTGLARVLDAVTTGEMRNIMLSSEDIWRVLPRLCAGSLGRLYCLFPDPWPKARHHKRRLVQSGFVEELARVVRSGGRVRLATDWADYAGQALFEFRSNPDFRWVCEGAADWREPLDHVPTRYQGRNLGDCAPVFLEFERL